MQIITDGAIADHGGRIANTAGDSIIAEFASAVGAVECAVTIQAALASQPLKFRIGVHVGDVIPNGEDLLGDTVNVAARLEGLAQPGSICISADAHKHVQKVLSLNYVELGPTQVKGLRSPVHAYTIRATDAGAPVQPAPALTLTGRPSIAVLPFANTSSDPEQSYFADGIAEDLIVELSRIKSFFVIARNSSFSYRGRSIDVRQVGRELGVRYVLEGSVRQAGDRLRITGQLAEAKSGRHIWADRFDGLIDDAFDFQDRITAGLVGAIEPNVTAAEIARARARPTIACRLMTCIFGLFRI